MEELQEDLSSLLGNSTYVKQGLQTLRTRHHLLKVLLSQKKLPTDGWDDATIEYILHELSALDSNNFPSNVGVGEREGRVFSSLVSQRHYGMSHGIGRSGDIAEVQPKAAGSSIIYKLTNILVKHALLTSGLSCVKQCLVVPMATGMTLTMSMLALKAKNRDAKYVIWPRIDQKSCFKSILTAGLIPLIVQNRLVPVNLVASKGGKDTGIETKETEGGMEEASRKPICYKMETDIDEIRRLLELHGKEVLCVLTTTSCFAPRQPDRVDEVAKLCQTFNTPHIINNAYGLQCPVIAKLLNRATVVGRVDAIIQSTDKNFLVPVGGAIIASPQAQQSFIKDFSSMYPGRANSGPILDLFITLLSMGESGYKKLLEERMRLIPILKEGLEEFCGKTGEIILPCDRNTISVGVSLISQQNTQSKGPSFFGAMLFQRSVSGCRVVTVPTVPTVPTTPPNDGTAGVDTEPPPPPPLPRATKIGGYEFISWGSHVDYYPQSYFTVACCIGLSHAEVTEFLKRLQKTFAKYSSSSTSDSNSSSSNVENNNKGGGSK